MNRQSRSTRRAARLVVAVALAGVALPAVTAGATETLAGTAILRHSVTHTTAGTAILRHGISRNGTAILR